MKTNKESSRVPSRQQQQPLSPECIRNHLLNLVKAFPSLIITVVRSAAKIAAVLASGTKRTKNYIHLLFNINIALTCCSMPFGAPRRTVTSTRFLRQKRRRRCGKKRTIYRCTLREKSTPTAIRRTLSVPLPCLPLIERSIQKTALFMSLRPVVVVANLSGIL